MESRSRSESPRTVSVNSVLILRRKCGGSLLERISRSDTFGIEYSDASPAWKDYPRMEAHLCSHPERLELPKTIHRQRLQRRFLNQSMVVLLNIRGNCSCLRAKGAHMVGHLPPSAHLKRDVEPLLVFDELASRWLSNQSRPEAFLALQEKQHEAHRREGEEIKTVSSRFPFIAPLERFDDFMKQSAQAEIA